MNQSVQDYARGVPDVDRAEIMYKRIGCEDWRGPEKVRLDRFIKCQFSRVAYRRGGPRSGFIVDVKWRPCQR